MRKGLWFFVMVCVLYSAHTAEINPKSCGIRSLFRLCDIIGRDLSEDEKRRIVEAYPQVECSMLDIKKAAATLGIRLIGVHASLEELSELPGPKILHLQNPAHFIVAARISQKWVQVIGRWGAYNYPREKIAKRYSGYSLILNPEEYKYNGGPRLVLEEFHYDFGIGDVGQQIAHSFTITNSGDCDLIITSQTNCCATLQVTPNRVVVAPGETSDLLVKFTILHPGKITISAKLLTNDPSQPVVFLTVGGRAPQSPSVWPQRLELKGYKGQPLRGNVRFSAAADVGLKEVKTENNLFLVTIEGPFVRGGEQVGESIDEGDEEKLCIWQLTAIYRGAVSPGEFHDKLLIFTDSDKYPLFSIPIDGEVVGELEVDPPILFFGFLRPGQMVSQRIYISARSGRPFSIKRVKVPSQDISAVIIKSGGRETCLEISLNPSSVGVREEKIEVYTDVPGEEILQVIIYAHIIDVINTP